MVSGADSSQELEDSSSSLHSSDWELMRQKMSDDGYLFFKNLLDPSAVMAARSRVAEFLSEVFLLTPLLLVSQFCHRGIWLI
jgi:hypothetical protein